MKVKLSGKRGGQEYFVIDEDDYLKVKNFTWWPDRFGRPQTDIWDKKNKKAKRVLIGRLIMNFPKNKVVDHINGDQLDNRKINLRICTKKQNQRNRIKLNKNNTSGFRGVSWDKCRRKWAAQLSINYKHMYLGRFDDIQKARMAVREAILEKHGEFANLRNA